MDERLLNQIRGTQQQNQNEARTASNSQFDWAANEGAFYNIYNEARQARGEDPIDYNDFTWKTHDFIGRMGVADGKWTQEDFDNRNYSNGDYDAYANELMSDLFGGYDPVQGSGTWSMETGMNHPPVYDAVKNTNTMDSETKAAYERMKKYGYANNWTPDAINERMTDRMADNSSVNWWDYGLDALAYAGDWIGSGAAAIWNTPYNMQGYYDDMATVKAWEDKQKNNAVDMLDNYETYIAKYEESKKNEKSDSDNSAEGGSNEGSSTEGGSTSTPKGDSFGDDVSEGETISYTYKPGDTFGQVVLDLGLGTGNGLWGTDGDVAFYNKQLWEQNAIDPVTGNIPIGTVIKLRKRKSN